MGSKVYTTVWYISFTRMAIYNATKLLLLTSQTKLTLTVALTLTDRVTVTSALHRPIKQTEIMVSRRTKKLDRSNRSLRNGQEHLIYTIVNLLELHTNTRTRGHSLKLTKHRCHLEIRRRVVWWNSYYSAVRWKIITLDGLFPKDKDLNKLFSLYL